MRAWRQKWSFTKTKSLPSKDGGAFQLGLLVLRPRGLAQRACPALVAFWGSETAGTFPESDSLQAPFQKVMATWLSYLDCVQRVADDDARCTCGSKRTAWLLSPWTPRLYWLVLRTEQRTQTLTFTYSVNAQSPEGTTPTQCVRHRLTHGGRQENGVKPGPCLKKQVP